MVKIRNNQLKKEEVLRRACFSPLYLFEAKNPKRKEVKKK
jgi:hypothetical protein